MNLTNRYILLMRFGDCGNPKVTNSKLEQSCFEHETQASSGILSSEDQTQNSTNFFQPRFIISNKEGEPPYTANPYCSFCMKVVQQHLSFSFYQLDSNHCYVAHNECIKMAEQKGNYPRELKIPVPSFVLRPVGQNRSSQEIKVKEECCLQIKLKHPLTDTTILCLPHRGFLADQSIELQFDQLSERPSCLPNSLCLPALDFFLEVKINEIRTGKQREIKQYVDFGVLKSQMNSKEYEITNSKMGLRVIATADPDTKELWMSKMQYKYPYPESEMIVKVLGFRFNFKNQDEQSSNNSFEGEQQTAQNILPSQDLRLSCRGTEEQKQPNKLFFSDSVANRKIKNKHKLSLQKMLKGQKLISALKSNTYSRFFQEDISSFNGQQIESLVSKLESFSVTHELVMHENANYSVQKLFQRATQSEKRRLFAQLLPYIRQIASSKQGTHTLQRFLEHLGQELRYQFSNAVGNELKIAFYDLCCDANATHFVQKCFELLKFQELHEFMSFAFENIAYFGVNKHAICVIKSMLQRLRDAKQVGYFCHQLVQHVVVNLDYIICDPFGNYVIQSIFDNIHEDYLQCLSAQILSHFKKYSMNTYAANVLVRCLEIHWIGEKSGKLSPRCYELQLNDLDLYEMLISKESNKVVACLLNKGLMGDRIVSIYGQCHQLLWNKEKWKRIVKKYLKKEEDNSKGIKRYKSYPSDKTYDSFDQTQGAGYHSKR